MKVVCEFLSCESAYFRLHDRWKTFLQNNRDQTELRLIRCKYIGRLLYKYVLYHHRITEANREPVIILFSSVLEAPRKDPDELELNEDFISDPFYASSIKNPQVFNRIILNSSGAEIGTYTTREKALSGTV